MNEEELSQELATCRLLACKCKVCKRKPDLHYDPGSTVMSCDCLKVVLPDWEPRLVLRVWNQLWLGNEWTQQRADAIIQKRLYIDMDTS